MSGFTGDGFRSFPPTYEDNNRVGAFSDSHLFPDATLQTKAMEYHAFVNSDYAQARGKEAASRVLSHIAFEQAYRNGNYDTIIAEAKSSGRYDMIIAAALGAPDELTVPEMETETV